eukprot:8551999-Pyramimonas_sp.AAC.1
MVMVNVNVMMMRRRPSAGMSSSATPTPAEHSSLWRSIATLPWGCPSPSEPLWQNLAPDRRTDTSSL